MTAQMQHQTIFATNEVNQDAASRFCLSPQQFQISLVPEPSQQIRFMWICDQQTTSTPFPSPSICSTLYLAFAPWLRAQQSSVSFPQLASYQELVATLFQRAQVLAPVASVFMTQQAPKLGLKVPALKVMKAKSQALQQRQRQRHLRSQQFQALSARGAPLLTMDFWAVYQQLWVRSRSAEAKATNANRTIRTLFML